MPPFSAAEEAGKRSEAVVALLEEVRAALEESTEETREVQALLAIARTQVPDPLLRESRPPREGSHALIFVRAQVRDASAEAHVMRTQLAEEHTEVVGARKREMLSRTSAEQVICLPATAQVMSPRALADQSFLRCFFSLFLTSLLFSLFLSLSFYFSP